MLVEYPAYRIALAFRSLKGEYRTDRIAPIVVQVLFAVSLLPIFISAWLVVVMWSVIYTLSTSIFTLPRNNWKDLQVKTEKKIEDKERAKYFDSTEKNEELEGDKDGDRRGSFPTTQSQEEKDNKKKQPKQKDTDEKKFQEKRSKDRDKEQKKLRKHVALLVNPPQLYDEKLKGHIPWRKKQNEQKTESDEAVVAAPLLDGDDASPQSPVPIASSQDPKPGLRSIWSAFRHRTEKAPEEKEAV